MDPELIAQAQALLDLCRRKQLKIAAAESCTGGLLAAVLTEIPGSSDVLERGFVTYSNEAKQVMLGVPSTVLERHGAVSQTAEAMARAPSRTRQSISRSRSPALPGPAVRPPPASRSGSFISPPRRATDG